MIDVLARLAALAEATRIPRRLLRAIGLAPQRHNQFSSFRAYLPDLIEYIDPRQVLEFGPGLSSRLILKHSKAELLSFETHPGYFECARKDLADPRVDLRFAPAPAALSGPEGAELAGRSFDFVFVDGGDRVANLISARELLANGAVVVLHDAHREDYERGVRAYESGYFIENHSLVLFRDRDRHRQLIERFPPNASCCCKYCGTSARIAYRRGMSKALSL